MLSKQRVEEAEKNVASYLQDGLIKKEPLRKIVYDTYMRNHRESLIAARKLLNENVSNLWAVVISYYSMFYIANAILFKSGYKVGSKVAHKVTADALIAFARRRLAKRLLEAYEQSRSDATELTALEADTLIESLDFERRKRSRFQYEMTEEVKESRARTSLERAKRFVFELRKFLGEPE